MKRQVKTTIHNERTNDRQSQTKLRRKGMNKATHEEKRKERTQSNKYTEIICDRENREGTKN